MELLSKIWDRVAAIPGEYLDWAKWGVILGGLAGIAVGLASGMGLAGALYVGFNYALLGGVAAGAAGAIKGMVFGTGSITGSAPAPDHSGTVTQQASADAPSPDVGRGVTPVATPPIPGAEQGQGAQR